ncbi:unnamed protein product [Amoebophrya sp. A120]|nr:unnamed protein product [Amoebophrya sp. A120]|eukprot:GSA120T00019775001.1
MTAQQTTTRTSRGNAAAPTVKTSARRGRSALLFSRLPLVIKSSSCILLFSPGGVSGNRNGQSSQQDKSSSASGRPLASTSAAGEDHTALFSTGLPRSASAATSSARTAVSSDHRAFTTGKADSVFLDSVGDVDEDSGAALLLDGNGSVSATTSGSKERNNGRLRRNTKTKSGSAPRTSSSQSASELQLALDHPSMMPHDHVPGHDVSVDSAPVQRVSKSSPLELHPLQGDNSTKNKKSPPAAVRKEKDGSSLSVQQEKQHTTSRTTSGRDESSRINAADVSSKQNNPGQPPFSRQQHTVPAEGASSFLEQVLLRIVSVPKFTKRLRQKAFGSRTEPASTGKNLLLQTQHLKSNRASDHEPSYLMTVTEYCEAEAEKKNGGGDTCFYACKDYYYKCHDPPLHGPDLVTKAEEDQCSDSCYDAIDHYGLSCPKSEYARDGSKHVKDGCTWFADLFGSCFLLLLFCGCVTATPICCAFFCINYATNRQPVVVVQQPHPEESSMWH